jgi:Tfp pilus assembly protein PilN
MRAVNLIPAEQRSGSSVGVGRSGGAAYAVVAMVAGLALMALLYGVAQHQVGTRTTQVAALEAKSQHAAAAAGQLAPYTTFIAMRQQRVQAVATLVDSRFDWAHAIHEFGRVLPADVSISGLTGTIAGASSSSGSSAAATPATTSAASAVTSVTPPGSVPTFSLSGCAASQAAVAEVINRLRLIDGVSNVTLQSSTKSGVAGSSSAGGACPSGAPTFTMQVVFQPLPTAPASSAATTVVAADESSASAPKAKTEAGVR